MTGNKIQDVLLITSEAFPYGMAGTNRIINLCKGFIANGINAKVLTFFKYGEPNDAAINPSSGVYEGIGVVNVFKNTVKNRFKVIRALHEPLKAVLVFFFVLKAVRRSTLVLYYSHESRPAILTKLVCSLKGALFIKEETEHPFVRVEKATRLRKWFFINHHYEIFDGLIVITNNLYKYFREELHFKKPMFVMPMIVDIDRFNTTGNNIDNNIVFSGVLDDQKEGVDMLIQAFSKVLIKYPDYTLNLYGKAPHDGQENLYKKMISALQMERNVLLHGYKTRDEMTKIFIQGKIFVFSRPHSMQADFGFSTKLGEYLATGKPVVATSVGEVNRFLEDKKNSFICNPDVNSITEKICEIIEDYDFALKVGEEGRKCVFENFNNKTETEKFIEQIQVLYSERFKRS